MTTLSMSIRETPETAASPRLDTMTVSTMLNGEYGIDDVCMSILNVVNNQGAHSKLLLPLTDGELKQLHHSAECLKNVIKSIKI